MVLALTGFGQDVPFGNAITLTNVKLSDPWATYPGGNPFPTVLNKNVPFPTYGSVVTHPYNTKPPMVNQWNLSVQRQIGTDWLVSANYIGTMSGTFTAFGDGSSTAMYPSPQVALLLKPSSAANIYWDVQAVTTGIPVSAQTLTITCGLMN